MGVRFGNPHLQEDIFHVESFWGLVVAGDCDFRGPEARTVFGKLPHRYSAAVAKASTFIELTRTPWRICCRVNTAESFLNLKNPPKVK